MTAYSLSSTRTKLYIFDNRTDEMVFQINRTNGVATAVRKLRELNEAAAKDAAVAAAEAAMRFGQGAIVKVER